MAAVAAGASQQQQQEEDYHVSPHARNKIVYKLMHIGESKCKHLIEEFNLCCKGKALSMVFCKGKYNASQACMHRYMNDENRALVERRWIDMGRPRQPNWNVLLEGIEQRGDRLGQQQQQQQQ